MTYRIIKYTKGREIRHCISIPLFTATTGQKRTNKLEEEEEEEERKKETKKETKKKRKEDNMIHRCKILHMNILSEHKTNNKNHKS